MRTLTNKVILLTGGAGSFGQEFTRQALKLNPKVIRIFSRGEFLQWEMERKFNDDRLRFFIGDVRDKDRLYRACQGVDLVVHAAALKQVPAIEYNPIEAVKTNILGAVNLIDAAIDSGVESVMAISSDKAVQPLNTYGKTKAVMESLITQANIYRSAKFSCVRYGNVEDSRGSVIPLFREQAKSGLVTITDERMTRFWLSVEGGVAFVINCLKKMQGGEIFVPKVPSKKVIDIAREIAPECEIDITGIRAGEKLHEILITEEEARHTRDLGDYYVIYPEYPFKEGVVWEGERLPEGFSYDSLRTSLDR